MGLRTRILAVLALATLVPAIFVGTLAVRRARRDVRREVVRGNLALVRATGAALDATLQDLQHALSLAAGALADTPPAPVPTPLPLGPRPENVLTVPVVPSDRFDHAPTQRLLSRTKRELPQIRRLTLLNIGVRRIAGDEIELPAFERGNTYGGYVSDAIRAQGARPTALVIVQARDRTGSLQGYLAAEIDLGFVEDTLAVARLSRGARLWVVDGTGEPIGTGAGDAATQPPHRAVEQAVASGTEGFVEENGTLAVYTNLASFQTVKGVSWAIVLVQPTRDAYALAAAATRDTVLVGAIVLAAVLAVGAWVATRITRLEEAARKAAERERLRAALARGEQLATVGALAAGVAHEINNPLTTILGYANLMLEGKTDPAERERLSLVADEARRVQGIVRTLLDHSRVESGPPRREAVDVNALVERTVALVAPTLKKRKLGVKVALGDALPRPTGDPLRLEQVLVNLAQNAAQAMEPGGELAISTAATAADGRVEIAVADTGPGIPKDVLGRIFDPFFTTKGPGVGTGLGLAIAQQIVLDHGGRIEVESELGRGSTFRVIL